MNDIYFDFSKSLSPENTEIEILGNPQILFDEEFNKTGCFFDGSSGIIIKNTQLQSSSFTIECIFRNKETTRESGIFGSNGYKLAYRSNRGELAYSFWANFPSSVAPKKIDNKKSHDSMLDLHYIAITRKDEKFSLFDNGYLIGTLNYTYNYWNIPLYLGYYYDLIYGFHGFIYEWKLSVNKILIHKQQIPSTLRESEYETG